MFLGCDSLTFRQASFTSGTLNLKNTSASEFNVFVLDRCRMPSPIRPLMKLTRPRILFFEGGCPSPRPGPRPSRATLYDLTRTRSIPLGADLGKAWPEPLGQPGGGVISLPRAKNLARPERLTVTLAPEYEFRRKEYSPS
jgi:hypothetical protein